MLLGEPTFVPTRPSGRLAGRVVARAALSGRQVDAMWRIFSRYYEATSRPIFERDLAEKDQVILLEDDGDRSLRGFSTLKIFEKDALGQPFVAIFSGDTIVEDAYWGQTALHKTFLRYVIGVKLGNLRRPVYWFLISKGYKTYLLLSRNFAEYWPRHDRPTPPWQQEILHLMSEAKYPDAYLRAQGILRFPVCEGRLKESVAPIEARLFDQPDVRFFLARNPGHARGEELCCLGHVGFDLWSHFTAKQLGRALARSLRVARKLWAFASASF